MYTLEYTLHNYCMIQSPQLNEENDKKVVKVIYTYNTNSARYCFSINFYLKFDTIMGKIKENILLFGVKVIVKFQATKFLYFLGGILMPI